MGAGGGERTDIEEAPEQRLLAQGVLVGQGMRLAPQPAGRVVAEGAAKMREGGVPGGPDDIRAGFPALCAAVVPPGRVGVASQPRQRAVDGAGGDQAVEEGIAQFVVQGASAIWNSNWLNSVAAVESTG